MFHGLSNGLQVCQHSPFQWPQTPQRGDFLKLPSLFTSISIICFTLLSKVLIFHHVCAVCQLVFTLLLPCLIFSQLGQSITLQKMIEWSLSFSLTPCISSYIIKFVSHSNFNLNAISRLLIRWFIPVNIILTSISGSLIGLLVALLVRPPYPFFKFTIVHIGIGIISSPLLLYYQYYSSMCMCFFTLISCM